MEEVSNKTIVALLSVALFVMIIGTVVSISKLGGMAGEYNMLTGAVATGVTNLTVTVADSAGISTDQSNTASFGSGYVTAGKTIATICSVGGNDVDSVCTSANWTNTTPFSDPSIVVENTGSVDINVTVSSDNTTAEAWLGGGADTAVAALSVRAWDTGLGEAGSCDDFNISGTLANGTYQDILNNAGKATVLLCKDLDYGNTADQIAVTFKVTIPYDATSGTKTTTLTFTGTSIGTQN